MAQESQELPEWLTYVATTITDDSGNPVATSSTLLYLPLTYYGPSVRRTELYSDLADGQKIPLGEYWTWGGLTPPGPTATVTVTGPGGTTSTSTAIPTTTDSTAIPSSTSNPSSSNPSSSSPTLTNTSSSTTPTSTPTSMASGGLDRGQLVGIIVGSILGAVAIFLFLLILFLRRRRRRENDQESYQEFPSDPTAPAEALDEWQVFANPPRNTRTPSPPRTPNLTGTTEGDALVLDKYTASPKKRQSQSRSAVPPAVVSTHSSASSSNNSGYGQPLDSRERSLRIGPIDNDFGRRISTGDDYRMSMTGGSLHALEEGQEDEESSLIPSDDGHMQLGLPPPSAYPAPRLVDNQSSQRSIGSRRTHRSSAPMDMEPAFVETARRIRVDGVRTSPETHALPLEPELSGSRIPILGALGGFGRFNWRFGSSLGLRRNSGADHDPESTSSLLRDEPPASPEMTERQTRGGVLGLTTEGERPVSGASRQSGASGGTQYYDASSSLGSSQQRIPPVHVPTPPPRLRTSMSQVELGMRWTPPSNSQEGLQAPQDLPPTLSSYGTLPKNVPPTGDILDTPVPQPVLSPYSAARASLPGLPQSFAALEAMSSPRVPTPVDTKMPTIIDPLEQAPPPTFDRWRNMTGIPGGAGNRATFGQPRPSQAESTSESGSLHSMRSHFSPNASRAAGSAPASRKEPSSGSSNAHSAGMHSSRKDPSSGSDPYSTGPRSRSPSSLGHANSISSSGRRRPGVSGAISPAVSALGHRTQLSEPERAYTPERISIDTRPAALDIRTGAASNPFADPKTPPMEARRTDTDMVNGHDKRGNDAPLSPLLMSPWVGGLDAEWTPT
ncbi:hypothetical protein CYLTODRAFT_415276 [Cylindrobasidium torrendii FP15055 ss-10]|uniref:Dystroglycan-type cadherin-like domain-containing protein n=1 Tax=Cylindrobasidium torrendii FP15055 ss-10 TaxID=1314674 RepID=A0A0D7AU09_9AGAR|nr:hypothetical protein CYLTODRAFT_415276 [Cylindrobasidium torrendii FP15055 ss-10]